MIGWKFEFGTLSDLSATIFSVFLLLLVLLVEAAVDPRSAPGGTGAVARAALDAAAMADLLYERRREAGGTRIDITRAAGSGRAVLVVPDGESTLAPAGLDRLLRAGGLPDPVRLYVFTHDAYAPVVAALQRHGRQWREISVPAALRQAGGTGWRDEFIALLGRTLSRHGFVRELAALLDGGTEAERRQRLAGGSGNASRNAGSYMAFAQFILRTWTEIRFDVIVNICAGLAGLAVVAAVERRSRVPARRS